MPLAKTGTCDKCDYEKMYCICSNQKYRNHQTGKRNTSGDLIRPPYQNYSEQPDYARHQHYDPNAFDRKFMEEFYPQDGESIPNYISRTNLASTKIVESSIYKHLYGGSKAWPSHTTSRYCPVCILAQQIEQLRYLIISLSEQIDMSTMYIKINENPTGHTPHLTIIIK